MAHNNIETVFCHNFGRSEMRVTGVVAECSMYDNKAQPSLHAMKEIAWHVTSDEKRGIGFISAKEWRQRKEQDAREAPLITPEGDIYYA